MIDYCPICYNRLINQETFDFCGQECKDTYFAAKLVDNNQMVDSFLRRTKSYVHGRIRSFSYKQKKSILKKARQSVCHFLKGIHAAAG